MSELRQTNRTSRTSRIVFVIACLLTLAYACSVYVPLIELDFDTLKLDWVAALNVARINHLQFGRDVIFTYGPLGFAWAGYHPLTFPWLITFWTVAAMGLWTALFLALRTQRFSRSAVVGILAVFFVLMSGEHSSMHDVRLLSLPIVLLLYHFRLDDRLPNPGKCALVVILSLAGLMKFTYLLAGLLACGVVSIDELGRYRRPLALPLFIACYVLGWIALGQSPANLSAYLRGSWIVASEFDQSMQRFTLHEGRDICMYVIPAVLLLTLIVTCKPRRWRALLLGSALLLMLMLTFKAGYVRHDEHEIIATSTLPPIVFLAAVTDIRRPKVSVRTLAWLLCFGAAIFAASFSYSTYAKQNFFVRVANGRELLFEEAREVWQILSAHESRMAVVNDDLRETVARMSELPQINGTTDAFLQSGFVIAAAKLNYSPRPALLSYAAYTPELAEADAEFLRGDRAPENIFFEFSDADGRFPALDDGRALLEIISRYAPTRSYGQFMGFRRRSTPVPYKLTPIGRVHARFMEPVSIPQIGHNIIWAQVYLTPTVEQRAISVFYKPPLLAMQLTSIDGHEARGRFVTGPGRSGFIISPLICDGKSLAELCDSGVPSASSPALMQSLRIGDELLEIPRRSYGETYYVEFFRVDRTIRSSESDDAR